MSKLWAQIAAWAKGKNITTHTVGAAILLFATAYDSTPALRNYIATVFVGYPAVVGKIGIWCANIAAGFALWRNFSRSSSDAGTVATAKVIESSPNPPTPAEVTAATLPLGTTKGSQ